MLRRNGSARHCAAGCVRPRAARKWRRHRAAKIYSARIIDLRQRPVTRGVVSAAGPDNRRGD